MFSDAGSTPAASTTLRRKGYAWQATKKNVLTKEILIYAGCEACPA